VGHRQAAVAIWLAVFLAACGGRAGPPPQPDQTLLPNLISLASSWDFGACDTLEVQLPSGEAIAVVQAGVHSPGCPDRTPTHFVFGRTSDLTGLTDRGIPWPPGKAPLVFVGTDNGELWLGSVRAWSPGGGWCFRFEKDEGAYREQGALHLSSGAVIDLARDFREPTYPADAFPLRSGDLLCLNDRGEATSVEIWEPY